MSISKFPDHMQNIKLNFSATVLKELRHDIFSHFFFCLNHGQSVGKPKNNGLPRKKNTKGVILEQKGARMAENGED